MLTWKDGQVSRSLSERVTSLHGNDKRINTGLQVGEPQRGLLNVGDDALVVPRRAAGHQLPLVRVAAGVDVRRRVGHGERGQGDFVEGQADRLGRRVDDELLDRRGGGGGGRGRGGRRW